MPQHLRTGRLLVLAAVIAALALPAAPVAAQEADGPAWSLTTNPVTVRRGGQAYQMRIMAFEFGGTENLSVSLSRTRDPSGVTVATQSQTYSFSLSGDRFTHASTLATAKLATARQMGQYGALALNFAKNAATKSSCNGHIKTRTGNLAGSVSLKTGTRLFGTITNRPSKATLSFYDGKCASGPFGPGTGGGNACPASGVSASLFRGDPEMSVFASKGSGARTAQIGVYTSQPLRVANGTLGQSITATVPAAKLAIADNLGTAKISAAAGTWVSGAANFTPSGDAYQAPAQACGSGKEYVSTSRPGQFAGTLKADFFTGSDPSVGQQASGALVKNVVR